MLHQEIPTNVYNYNKRYRKNDLAVFFLNFLNKLIQLKVRL